jgi:xanthine dehydrogenase accessory factor
MVDITNANNVLEQAISWMGDDKQVALATVISTWGSSPRPMGSQLAIDETGSFVGSVSGGCIEGSVIGEALETISDGENRLLDFGVTNEQAWEVGLACGGDVRILVERTEEKETLRKLINERPIAAATNIATGEKSYVTPTNVSGNLNISVEMLKNIRAALQHDRSTIYNDEGSEIFIQVFNPALRCAIIGAVHISQALIPMAQIAGFDVTVIDPRGSFATPTRFPNVKINEEWPDDALRTFNPDSRTSVVTLTHDPKLDDPALEVALKTNAFYIGCLGSRRTHASRLDRLALSGFKEIDFTRIHAPIGLDLGATSPEEIAIAILAEMIAAKHGKLNA